MGTEPDFILAGVPKGATTWIYECLVDHPKVHMPQTDSLNFFDLNYHRGMDWYYDRLDGREAGDVLGEATPGYLSDPFAAERIAKHVPDATLLFCLRNPIERAFSQWWHGKSDGYWSYEFEEIFSNTPPYQMWVVPGFYDRHLQRFDRLFPSGQLHLLFLDDLIEDAAAFIEGVYATIGVDTDHTPEIVHERVNEAHYSGPEIVKRWRNWVENNAPEFLGKRLNPAVTLSRQLLLDRSQYERGMEPKVREQLEMIYLDDIRRLERRSGRDLNDWFEYVAQE